MTDRRRRRIGELDTPCLILDRTILERNADAMGQRARRAGVSLRPHLKTAKSAEVAAIATRGWTGGITVSTLREAEYFLGRGFPDITYAVAMVPDRLERAAALRRRGAALRLLVSDPGVAAALPERAAALGEAFEVLLEVDTGHGRGGVAPDCPELLEMAARLERPPHSRLAGILTHAGQAYGCTVPADIAAAAEEERRGAVEAATRLRASGHDCPVVSVGSTPTLVHGRSLQGVTEVRPGTYLFQDLVQEGLGVCRREDLALTVLATVLGHSPKRRRILLDAGSLALSPDAGAAVRRPEVGYGLVVDLEGRDRWPGLRVAALNQEHGLVESDGPLPYDDLPVGSKVRVLPGHACITAAMHDGYHLLEDDEVTAFWERVNRW